MATFTKKEISEMVIDMIDDWVWDDNNHCNIKIGVGNSLYYKLEDWFVIKRSEHKNFWLDIYADMSPCHATVNSIYVKLRGRKSDDPTEIEFNIINQKERRLIYNTLVKSGGEAFLKFLRETA